MAATGSDGSREIRASRSLMEVTEWELQRILLDIHDGPVQHMYAALSQLDLLRRSLGGAGKVSPEADQLIERIRRLLERGLGEVRSFIGAFRPPEFESRDLVALLEGLVLQHEADTDMDVTLEVDGRLPEVTLAVKIALYRVLQEALSNAYRHGGADRVAARLVPVRRGDEAGIEMRIVDNGAGFDPAAVRPEQRFGLKGMRDRMEMIGGSFSLKSSPGRGTVIVLGAPAA
ncbi:MAG: sensor histidine kinase [Gemmatimonadota bacterium]